MNRQTRTKTVSALVAVAMAVVILTTTSQAGAGLINTGFETPDKGTNGWSYAPTDATWAFAAGAGLSGPNGPWKADNTSPDPLGDQFAYLQGVATIAQDLDSLGIGSTYNLSFFESYRVAMASGNNLAVILDDGLATEMTIYSTSNVDNRLWESRQTADFLAAKDSYTLTFRTTNPLDGDRTTLIGCAWN